MTLLRKVYYWWFNSLELKEDNTKEKKARSYSKATERSLCCAAEKSACCHILSSCSAECLDTDRPDYLRKYNRTCCSI